MMSTSLPPPFRVSRDGQRVLFMVPVDSPQPIRVLVNWLPASP